MFRFKRLSPLAILPTRGNPGDVGLDLYATETVVIPGQGKNYVKTGWACEIPDGYYGRIAPRSGLAYRSGIDILGGVIDKTYRGELIAIIANTSANPFVIEKGDRAAQFILEACIILDPVEVDELSETSRGHGGFGSTGV